METFWAGFLTVGAISAFLLVLFGIRNWPILGIAAVCANILIAWEVPQLNPLVNIIGTNIYPLDVLSVVFLMISFLDIKRLSDRLGSLRWMWLGFGVTIVSSLAWGILTIEAGAAVNEFRAFLYPFAAISWVVSLDWNQNFRRFSDSLPMILGWLLVVVAAYHSARFGLGGAGEFVDPSTGLEQTTRPLVSGQALVLLFCTVMSIRTWAETNRKLPLASAIVFGLTVLVVQQRTVWAVAAAMIVAFYFSSPERRRGKSVIAAVVVVWALLVVLSSNIVGDLISKVVAAANDSATYDARVVSWQNLIAESFDKGLATVLFGAPFGTGYGRFEGVGRWVEFAPHNWYVTLFLRVGLVGTSLFLLFLAGACFRVLRDRGDAAQLLILVGTVVYCWAYSVMWYTALFVGWALIQRVNRTSDPLDENRKLMAIQPLQRYPQSVLRRRNTHE